MAKAEHCIEESFQRGKSEASLGDYQVRNWIGWQQHQTLSLIAAWFLNDQTRRKKKIQTPALAPTQRTRAPSATKPVTSCPH